MKKVSEVLKLAIPLHAAGSEWRAKGICFVLADMQRGGIITELEKDITKSMIYSKCQHKGKQYGWLYRALRAKKKASNLAARVAFYERFVKQLEKQGK